MYLNTLTHFGLLTKYWSNLNILDVLKHSITLQNSQEEISHTHKHTLKNLKRNDLSSIRNRHTQSLVFHIYGLVMVGLFTSHDRKVNDHLI